ncbi:thermonuclease family protein [Jannaschia seohaensis]|uniref:Endonuclease YncB(Thermonuclease family) n=1 Tax=Jannaschia seohaensis TaxID=475081 RepID=A0A2Y9AVQ8_9RHOB|nr:thermonuclease family protein [Jannaschia seohaensis]PWJ16911.1 endonuclease YncB(thermonuclease family) [Jannaschia seohaensis]SSA48116.1 Endonuclease YncB, thermonuclease family [Jannaschia seohaensis]
MLRVWTLLLCLLAAPVSADILTGSVRVIDADTIDIGADRTMRLKGIDAAEDGQDCADGARLLPCGRMATEAARALYEGRTARCAIHGIDRFDRALAVCEVAGREMNAELVARGLARAYRRDPTYLPYQQAAQRAGHGLWAYEMQNPAAWRAARRAAQPSDPAPEGCRIKGNVSASGRIYHKPGDSSYAATRIDTGAGERWFCTEAEARRAGWRPPRR